MRDRRRPGVHRFENVVILADFAAERAATLTVDDLASQVGQSRGLAGIEALILPSACADARPAAASVREVLRLCDRAPSCGFRGTRKHAESRQ